MGTSLAFQDFLASFMTYSAETNKKIVQDGGHRGSEEHVRGRELGLLMVR